MNEVRGALARVDARLQKAVVPSFGPLSIGQGSSLRPTPWARSPVAD
jgi:hypothetical protein